MAASGAQNAPDIAMSHEPKSEKLYELDEKGALFSNNTSSSDQAPIVEFPEDLEGEEPTEEELVTLERISGKIPWTSYTIAFVELCERFGWYGSQVLCKWYKVDRNIIEGTKTKFYVFRHEFHPIPTSAGIPYGKGSSY